MGWGDRTSGEETAKLMASAPNDQAVPIAAYRLGRLGTGRSQTEH